jgi:predicted transcriptional regulator
MGRGTELDLSGAAALLALEKLEALTVRLECARGRILEQALVGFIVQDEERRRLTLEALADVDSGRLVTYEAVQAWAESLDKDNPLPLPLPLPLLCRSREGPRER